MLYYFIDWGMGGGIARGLNPKRGKTLIQGHVLFVYCIFKTDSLMKFYIFNTPSTYNILHVYTKCYYLFDVVPLEYQNFL